MPVAAIGYVIAASVKLGFRIAMIVQTNRLKNYHQHPDLIKLHRFFLIAMIFDILKLPMVSVTCEIVAWKTLNRVLQSSMHHSNSEIYKIIKRIVTSSTISAVFSSIFSLIMYFFIMIDGLYGIYYGAYYLLYGFYYFIYGSLVMNFIAAILQVSVFLLIALPILFHYQLSNHLKKMFFTDAKGAGIEIMSVPAQPATFQPDPKTISPNKKFCGFCGEKNYIEARFCEYCGMDFPE